MNNPPIRYCGYEFPYNPESIEITKNMLYFEMPENLEKGTLLKKGIKARKITGKGAFFGNSCIKDYNELMEFFIHCESGILNISGLTPMFAKLTKLNLMMQPSPNCIEYKFEFIEDVSCYDIIADISKYHIVKNQENLWSIANLYSMSVDELYRLNPHIKIVNQLSVGERLTVI